MKINTVVVAALIFGAAQANAGISGDTVNATYYFPDSSSSYSPYGDIPNAIVGTGVEFAGGENLYPYSYFDVDLSDSGVLITFLNDAPYSGGSAYWESSITFNGLKLTNLTKNFEPSALSESSHDLVDFSWSGDTLSFNWQGVHFNAGDQIIVTTTSIPEPTTYTMILASLLLLSFMAHGGKKNPV